MKNYLSVELIPSTLNFSFFLDFRETLTTLARLSTHQDHYFSVSTLMSIVINFNMNFIYP